MIYLEFIYTPEHRTLTVMISFSVHICTPGLPQLAISQNCNQQCYLIASRLCQQSDIDWLIH